MDSHNAQNGAIAARLLRLREALEKVEERNLLSKQQALNQLIEEEQNTVAERDLLLQAVVGSGSREQRLLSLHQWQGMQARLEAVDVRRRDTTEEVHLQQQSLQAAHIESERWRSFYQTDLERWNELQRVVERRELDEVALLRHRPQGAGEDT